MIDKHQIFKFIGCVAMVNIIISRGLHPGLGKRFFFTPPPATHSIPARNCTIALYTGGSIWSDTSGSVQCAIATTAIKLQNKGLEEYRNLVGNNKYLIIDEAQKIDNIGQIPKVIMTGNLYPPPYLWLNVMHLNINALCASSNLSSWSLGLGSFTIIK